LRKNNTTLISYHIQEAKLVLYADDTNILVIGKDKEALQAKLSSVMKQLEVWFLKNDLIINTTKTAAMSVHLCQSKPSYKPRILLQNTEIVHMSEVKFLGMYIYSHSMNQYRTTKSIWA
jgi:phage pi2 protein 07